MAQQNTGLGWSAESSYLLEPDQFFGIVVVPTFNPNTVNFSGGPSISELQQFGASFISGGTTYYVGVNCRQGYAGGALEIAVYRNAENAHYLNFVCFSDEVLRMYYPRFYITDGVTIQYANDNYNYNATTPDADTGLYTLSFTLIYYSSFTFSALSDGSAITGTTLADVKSKHPKTTINAYKLNFGYAVACFAKWLTTEGNKLISPILISTYPDAAILSNDGTAPATPQSPFDILHEGLHFKMHILPGIDGNLGIASSNFVPIIDLTQFGAAMPSKVFALIASSSFANIEIPTSPDPYQSETDPSEPDGGEGEDIVDDPVDEETMPIPAVVGLGFSTIYVPTQADLYSLAAYLWGGNLDLTTFLKLFANPMDSILGLSAVPLVLSGTYEPIYLGGQLLQGITLPRYTGRTAVKVDMGTVTIKERWGAYLDYDPYTELAVYVPFVGIKNVKADDVMGKTVRLMYDIDILSGACIAYLRPEGGSVLYEWSGQCAMQIPITGANWDNIFSTAINTAATLGGALFAPASAPVLGGAVASAASQAIAAKPRIERSGAVNGITGFLGQLRPYIIRTIPEAYIPNDQNKFIGYPSYVSVSLGQLSGYNEIASIHLENIPATGDELSELESILKGGVIF